MPAPPIPAPAPVNNAAARLTALEAASALIPVAPSIAPVAESVTPAIGKPGMYAAAGHVHQRLTSVTTATLDANGMSGNLAFTRSFTTQPGVVLTAIMPGGSQPVILNVQSWITDTGGNYTGCVIKGYRTNTLPSTLAAVTALASFNIASGSASGVQVSVVAIQSS